MSKRLSTIFGGKSDDTGLEASSPSKGRLHKNIAPAFSQPNLADPSEGVTPLAPPPLLTGDGYVRPPSSMGTDSPTGSRAASPHSPNIRSRPQTPNFATTPVEGMSPRPMTPTSTKAHKRSSWLPKSKSRGEEEAKKSKAWIAGLRDHVPYDLTQLLNGERVPELWNEYGDTVISLFPSSNTSRGPSFKIDSALIADSAGLQLLRLQSTAGDDGFPPNDPTQDPALAQFNNMSIHSPIYGSNGYSQGYEDQYNTPAPRQECHIHLPLNLDNDLSIPGSQPTGDDIELIILYRNFFAFLLGGALIATDRQLSLFSIFLGIGSILKRFRFGNLDASTWGEVPTNSFARYCLELRLADVRTSREKTVEAIVLGEQMRYWPLYNEGFVHAAGRLEDIKIIQSPKFSKISPITVNRLERAHLDIDNRLQNLRLKLQDLDFPSMFSGIANSQTSSEGKFVRFKSWKAAFIDMRKFTMQYYRRKYGAWPPKASSKKNDFEESGLNRVLVQELYRDFTDLYDMLADCQNLTPRTTDMAPITEVGSASDETLQHAIRRVEGEYDRATPPVLPPIPFDVPIIPGFQNSFNRTHVLAKKTSIISKKLKETEVNEILLGSYNRENIRASPWIREFMSYERKGMQGLTLDEIVDCRCGQWLFMYAVLQTLPMTVVDARDLMFTEGVEYFLCIAPRGGRSWMKEDTAQSRAWYNVASGGGVVSLPADLIDHSVEGIYRRSHCWQIATKWAQNADLALSSIAHVDTEPSFEPPPMIVATPPHGSPAGSPRLSATHGSPAGSPHLRPGTPGERLSRLSNSSSVNLGLEAMTAPPDKAPRPVSTFNPNTTFDSILGPELNKKGRRSKK